ncbi:MAG: FAD-binding protein [Desulfobacterales bacterium]|nr:MAG: FAD-binding protein [Desulfobacterales bacterium]
MLTGEFIRHLRRVVGDTHVSVTRADTELYSYDASLAKGQPGVVVFPADSREVAQVVRAAHQARVPFVPRGFGTNLSGGTVLPSGGLVICLARLNRILGIYPERRCAVVQPGVTNLELQQALAPRGFFYAPDPASQKVATLGGNVGENSGGPHCLKYGVTTNHILGMEVVLAAGETVRIAGAALDPPGYDVRGVMVGSEGTLALVTEVTVRILPKPESIVTMLAIYNDVSAAAHSVSAIMAAGIVPATLEMMDAAIIKAVEDSYACGYPRDAAAVLIIEVEGPAAGLQEQARRIQRLCIESGCREIIEAKDDNERNRLWEGRRGAFGAVARLAPNYLVNDCTVPRTKLPEALARVAEITAKYKFEHGNVFHAGDGNLHPLLLFDSRDADQLHRVEQAGWEIMQACVQLGGTISGEHGIGSEKREAMRMIFSEEDFNTQRALQKAFDPHHLINPGKVLPPPKDPKEVRADARKEAVMPAPGNDGAVQEIMARIREAASARRAVLPTGNGSCLDFGNFSERPVDLLASRKLAEVIAYDPPNQVVTVGAGMSLEALQGELQAHHQWLPVRPPCALQGHTAGGLAALGACGPERLFYGAPRDLLLGLRFINAGGQLITAGGQVVKNVAGYDMARLLTGSAGTLGFITALTLRVATLPERCTAITAEGTLDQCAQMASALLTSNLWPTFVTAVPAGHGSFGTVSPGWQIQVGFEGFSETVRYQLAKTATWLSQGGMQSPAQSDYPAHDGRFSELYADLDRSAFVCRADFPLDRMAGFVEALTGRIPMAHLLLDWGGGRILAGIDNMADGDWAHLADLAAESQGHILLEKAPEEFKRRNDVFGRFRPEWKIMHRIKAELDPQNMFAPGRLPGKV